MFLCTKIRSAITEKLFTEKLTIAPTQWQLHQKYRQYYFTKTQTNGSTFKDLLHNEAQLAAWDNSQKNNTHLTAQSGFTEARDSEWQWQQLGHMQICTSPQTDNHASIPPLSFLQAGCPSCHPTNSVRALKALLLDEETEWFLWLASERACCHINFAHANR